MGLPAGGEVVAVNVVATSDPASLTDAGAIMKRLRLRHNERRFRMAVNLTRREHEARETARTSCEVAVGGRGVSPIERGV